MPDIYGLWDLAATSIPGVDGPPTNKSWSAVMGGQTSYVIGNGSNSHTYSQSTKTVTNFAELLRFAFSSGPSESGLSQVGNFLGGILLYGGGETSFLFGSKQDFTYRLSPTFKVDRYHVCTGLFNDRPTLRMNDISHIPADDVTNKNMVLLAAFFSLINLTISMLAIHFYNNGSVSEELPTDSEFQNKDTEFYKQAGQFANFPGALTPMITLGLLRLVEGILYFKSSAVKTNQKLINHLYREIENLQTLIDNLNNTLASTPYIDQFGERTYIFNETTTNKVKRAAKTLSECENALVRLTGELEAAVPVP